MKILAIDTATKVAGIAIVDENGVLAESWLNTGKTHSQRLLPMLEGMLSNADISWEEIHGFAVTVGPGSFTGLRIGLATVKGLAQVLDKPFVGIVSLDALAHNITMVPGLICPMLDARKNEVYTALYRDDAGSILRLSPYRAVAPHLLLEELSRLNERVTFLGDAVAVYRDLIEKSLPNKAFFAPPTRNLLRASEVAFLGLNKLQQGEKTNIHDVKPFYLRPSEAEVKWAQNHGGCCI
ncbi:tRNA (adenosine(37)-N6)-threonylcarbamoyltransferase complex dimerization subunit type 1 TsaB [Candidatus Formimonas warabiya]|uniref:tRNA (Adenosine(37)-N6)-threonylcarbamoyltransferase complex dimerization subunit type 1 TsaB n=1 Tax=Formimonas warabiya TaxID=1761012 RepID=A0A3G1KT16_FORW1|nr:tRNA (adenosine(37)-N6)-threonylcarbamoyltransferase complex dimerization subunit type 1 TsaB [Candidatus Formimonas warabiya]ATW25570.1 tRNA (adenosine(37)-N6)-threonylcarbamoyltransferase complex dimerization subunit type 1 TsaB [Candidatus Formimonas warabiya]